LSLLVAIAAPSAAQTNPIYTINTVAGGGPNNLPALASSMDPVGVAEDAAGNVYIASYSSSRVFRVDTAGNLTVLAGNGLCGYSGDGGPATQAEICDPRGKVALDSSGDLFIADTYNCVIREVVAATGFIQTIAGNGTCSYSGDGGLASQAELSYPYGVFVDGSGNVFIADSSNARIREVIAATGIIQTVAGDGTAGYSGDGGLATQAELYYPYGVFVDGSGNIFIADTVNQRVREVIAATGIIQTVAGDGTAGYSGDGIPATQAELFYPEGVFVDGSGNIFIADTDNARVREVIATTGIIQTVAGDGIFGYSGDGGLATQAELYYPEDVLVGSQGNLLIADEGNSRLRQVSGATGIIQTTAGNGSSGDSGDGYAATNAQLSSPEGVSVNSAGDVVIADTDNCVVREILASKAVIQTIAGVSGYCASEGATNPPPAQLGDPWGVFVDGSGNVFITDTYNSEVQELVAATGVLQTVAGNGIYGYYGDGGPATEAELAYPEAVFVDGAGNIFIADTDNSVIREVVAATGNIQTVAGDGTAGYLGDGGPATHAELNYPAGVFVDSKGNIFIADTYNSVIREVLSATGDIETVAGNGTFGYLGDGGLATQAELADPAGVVVDSVGDIFIADTVNDRIRVVYGSTGVIDTIAGNGVYGFSGDGGSATSAELAYPVALTLDSLGNILIAESDSSRIRQLTPSTPPIITTQPQSQTINSGQTATLTVVATGGELSYQWYLGLSGDDSNPISGATAPSYTTPALTTTTSYWVQVSNIAGAANSNTATITVNIPVTITTQPANQTINSGQTATLSVVATGTAPLSYQWYQGPSGDTSNPISGATGSSYTTPALTSTTSYWVQVSNVVGSVNSNTATITVQTGPAITTQPANQTINSGQTATLTVVATGTAPLTYQWYQGSSGDTSNPIAGATNSSYTTPALTATSSYWVKVSNVVGSVNSSTATITVQIGPAITTQPASQTINPGQTATLSVVATGTAPLSYQWYQGASGTTTNPIAGATGSSYTTPTLTSGTSYWVQVSNVVGSTNSSTATITVNIPVTITTQPVGQIINSGQTATLSVVATGTAPLSYQWYQGASGTTTNPIAGAMGSSYTTPALTSTTSYWVLVSNVAGSASSNTATVTVAQAPTCAPNLQGTADPLTITAVANCTDPQGESLTITVDWGDGSPQTTISGGSAQASHTYSQTGTFTIVFTSTNTSALKGTATVSTTLASAVQGPPPIQAGQTATFPATLPAGPTSTSVQFTCTTVTDSQGNVQQASALGISCTSPVIPLTSEAQTVTITLSTTGGSSARLDLAPPDPSFRNWLAALWLPIPAMFLIGMSVGRVRRPRRCMQYLLLATVGMLLVLLVGCGGGFTAPQVTSSTTPAGSYTVTAVDNPVNSGNTTGFVQTSLIVPLTVSPP
jgi:hypothetical protein